MTTKFSTEERTLLVDALKDARDADNPREASVGVLKTLLKRTGAPGFPAVETLAPEDDATSVAVDAEISCLFDQNIEEADFSGITVIKEGETESITFDSTTPFEITGDNKLEINPETNLDASDSTYTVTIPAGTVKTAAAGIGNREITWSFTTVTE